MIEFITKIFDEYTLKARLIPAFFLFLPISIIVITLFPNIALSQPAMIVGTLSFLVFSSLSVNFVRDRGKAIEDKLYEDWGGKPTTVLLRHSSSTSKVKLNDWHQKINKLTGVASPSQAEESNNPKQADEIYDNYVEKLRTKTRDNPLVFKENYAYGFRRNLLGIRSYGLSASAIAILINLIFALNEIKFNTTDNSKKTASIDISKLANFIGFPEIHAQSNNSLLQSIGELKPSELSILIGLAIGIFLLIFWWRVNSDWVKTAAYTYARRLLEAAEDIT